MIARQAEFRATAVGEGSTINPCKHCRTACPAPLFHSLPASLSINVARIGGEEWKTSSANIGAENNAFIRSQRRTLNTYACLSTLNLTQAHPAGSNPDGPSCRNFPGPSYKRLPQKRPDDRHAHYRENQRLSFNVHY